MTNSPSVGGVEESSQNISPSLTHLNAQDVKQSTNTFKENLRALVSNPKAFNTQECFVGQIILEIDKDDAELLIKALADKKVRHIDLVRLLEAEGYKMSEATMRRHRGHGCRCPRV